MMTGHMSTSPKMLEQFADRAKRMDGCVKVGDDIYEFAQNSNVICIIGLAYPTGYMGKDARRAAEIRKILSAATP